MADYSQEIAYLESVLNGATRQVDVAETRTVFDLDATRRRLAQQPASRCDNYFKTFAANEPGDEMPEQDFGAGAATLH